MRGQPLVFSHEGAVVGIVAQQAFLKLIELADRDPGKTFRLGFLEHSFASLIRNRVDGPFLAPHPALLCSAVPQESINPPIHQSSRPALLSFAVTEEETIPGENAVLLVGVEINQAAGFGRGTVKGAALVELARGDWSPQQIEQGGQ